jgi:hypothetical protein
LNPFVLTSARDYDWGWRRSNDSSSKQLSFASNAAIRFSSSRCSLESMRTDPLIVRAYLTRGAKLWLLARALLTLGFMQAAIDPFRLSAVAFVTVVVLSVALGFLEIRRHRERALLGNLGVSPFMLGALFTGPALVGEIAIRLGMAAFA